MCWFQGYISIQWLFNIIPVLLHLLYMSKCSMFLHFLKPSSFSQIKTHYN